jgi:hypothetical protein
MPRLHRVVIRIERATSQISGNPAYEVQLLPNSRPTKCGRCGRGVIIIRWLSGEEPFISNCRVCGAKTTVTLTEQVWIKERSK